MNDQERLEAIKEEFFWNVKQENALPISHSDTEWLFEQAEKLERHREAWLDENRRRMKMEGALDAIRRIAADPVFRFYAAPRSKQEILVIAERALKDAKGD